MYAESGSAGVRATMAAAAFGALLFVARPCVAPQVLSDAQIEELTGPLDFQIDEEDANFGQWHDGKAKLPLTATAWKAQYEMEFACGCGNAQYDFSPKYDDIRALSDQHLDETSDKPHEKWTNFFWAWGQYVMHDMVHTVGQMQPEEPDIGTYDFDIGPMTMKMQRVHVRQRGQCRVPLSMNSPQLDGSNIYSDRPRFEREALREPGDTCRLAVGPGDFLPLSESPMGGSARFVAGALLAACALNRAQV
jgi:Animal haem peroxidase